MVNSGWLEGEKGADPKISVQFLESAPVDLKIEEVEDVEILSVRERQQSHQSASTSAKAPGGAFAWLVGGEATTATCTEVRVARGECPTFSGKMAVSSRPLKSLLAFSLGYRTWISPMPLCHCLGLLLSSLGLR